MKTSRFLTGALLALLTTVLVGGAFAADKVTIRIMTRWAGSDPQAAFLASVKADFLKTHPNVVIQDDSIADEAAFNNKLKIDIATGTPPSIFWFPAIAGLLDWAKAGVLMDITPMLADKAWSSGFIPGTTELWSLDKYGVKGRYAVPFQMSPEVIWYNPALFAKAGIVKVPATMDELYAAIDKLKAAKIVPWGLGGKDPWRGGHIFNNVIYRIVGVDYIKDIGARKAKWTDAALRPAYDTMKDLVKRGAFDKGFIGMSYDDETAGFFAGDYAMTCNGSWFMSNIATSKLAGQIKFMPFPIFKGKEKFSGDSVLFPGGFQMSGKMTGAEKDAAIEFVKFITSKEMTTRMVTQYSVLGARTDTDLTDPNLSPLLKEMVNYMGTIKNAGGDYGDYDPDIAVLEKIRSALQGLMLKDSSETAAKASQAEIDAYEKSRK